MNTHEKWFNKATKNASTLSAATMSGLSHVTLGRKLKQDRLEPGDVIAIARAYGHNPVVELAKLNFITKNEVSQLTKLTALDLATDEEIAHVVYTRLLGGSAGPAITGPLTN